MHIVSIDESLTGRRGLIIFSAFEQLRDHGVHTVWSAACRAQPPHVDIDLESSMGPEEEPRSAVRHGWNRSYRGHELVWSWIESCVFDYSDSRQVLGAAIWFCIGSVDCG